MWTDVVGGPASREPAVARGLVALSAFSSHTISDIVAACNAYGSGTVTAVGRVSSVVPTVRCFGALNHNSAVDVKVHTELMIGLTAIYAQHLVSGQLNNDYYEVLLSRLYGLPPKAADVYASKIETIDAIDPSHEGWGDWLSRQTHDVVDGISAFAKSMGFTWEWDRDQSNDFDRLFELRSLGEVITEMGQRSALIKGYANWQHSIFGAPSGKGAIKAAATGDLELIGDLDGDVTPYEVALTKLIMSALPSAKTMLTGMAGDIANANKSACAQAVRDAVANDPGGNFGATIQHLSERTPKGRKLMAAAKGAKGVDAVLAASKAAQLGDLLERVGDVYGDDVVDAFAVGDLEGVFDIIDATPVSQGDLELIGDLDAETGGITGLALKMAKRRLGRSQGRADQRITRKTNRASSKSLRDAARRYTAESKAYKPEPRTMRIADSQSYGERRMDQNLGEDSDPQFDGDANLQSGYGGEYGGYAQPYSNQEVVDEQQDYDDDAFQSF